MRSNEAGLGTYMFILASHSPHTPQPIFMGPFRILVAVCSTLLSAASCVIADGNVTFQSLEIFTTHEWLGRKPTVYFQCQGEDKVYLPDIGTKGQLYTFRGLESWQPLVNLAGKRCKRCGLFEKDTLKSDDVFNEWELCPFDFSPSPEGSYTRFVANEFNLTFLCPTCNMTSAEVVAEPAGVLTEEEESHHGLTIAIVIFAILSVGGFAFVVYTRWRRKQRETQQARFIKLFEDDVFLDDELGLKDGL